MVISHLTSKSADNLTFFTANKQSPWYLVAFGMIGASLSGVTFISVPGEVGNTAFSYFQVVLGYLVGYFVIAAVLLPLYYRLNLISIYTYLEQRFGTRSYKTGAFFFLLSRIVGSAFRLFLVAGVLQIAIFDAFKWPFSITVAVTIALIWLYTFRGGIKTIVWTDTLQTLFMISAVVISIYLMKDGLDMSWTSLSEKVSNSGYSKIFVWDWQSGKNFFKQFVSGAFIAIVMTGLDQDMMQKNLTCRTLKDAQKNMFWFCIVLVIVNFLFLSMGALLYVYAEQMQITLPQKSDDLYPMLALQHFPAVAGVVFLLGIVAAAYSSADSALTALTTSFCVDFLGLGKEEKPISKKLRIRVHLGFSVILFAVILIFKAINDDSVITAVFTAAGYTYGPILGLFTFGLITKYSLKDKYVPIVCLLSPVLSYIININSEAWLNGYKFGFEILVVNGLLTFIGLFLLKEKNENYKAL
ncbi:sodium/iodide co-transporter [Marivirga lumbricoides]|uniref:Sodium/iodide co-transporter n=3 Tax=Marivirga lumbricoides TaxID=1046115 RepID=A0ABQ1MMT6_9BACT|nr:sodium/iodide co-transporter [Marivirga lumbricoides]